MQKEGTRVLNQKLQEAWETVREELGKLFAQGKASAQDAWSQATGKQKRIAMGLGALGLVLVFVGIIGLAAVIGCSSSAPAATSAQASDAKIYLHVTAGRTSKEIGQELEQHGVIANHWKFWLVAKMNGYDNQIKTGIYELHPNMEPRDVLQMLVNGETTRIKFTIPEGFRIRDIAKRLGDEGIVDEQEFLRKAETCAREGTAPLDLRARDIRIARREGSPLRRRPPDCRAGLLEASETGHAAAVGHDVPVSARRPEGRLVARGYESRFAVQHVPA